MKSFRIDRRGIGPGNPVFVVAEIGVNHNGQLARALQLVDVARACGADAVKFQLFAAEELMHAEHTKFAAYQEQSSRRARFDSPVDMLKRYELRPLEVAMLVEAIRAAGLVPLATPFSLSDVETIASLRLPAVKIASPDLVNRALLHACSRLGVPMFVSTGAATMDEACASAGWLRDWGVAFSMLHCVSSYPTADDDAHLVWIHELSEKLRVPIGYSDHTTNALAGAFAVAAGACVVEKHLTFDRHAAGPDHAASADPRQFADYVRQIRIAEQFRGQGGKRVLPVERDVRTVSRQSLVLRRELREGEPIGEADVVFQRPGTGIPVAQLATLVGRKVRTTLRAGTLLQWDMLADVA